jgi:hypothetical protein
MSSGPALQGWGECFAAVGCLFPLIAKTRGNMSAVVLAAGALALCHGPTNCAQYVSFVATGVAYGWIRVVSGTRTAPPFAHAAYHLNSLQFSSQLRPSELPQSFQLYCIDEQTSASSIDSSASADNPLEF